MPAATLMILLQHKGHQVFKMHCRWRCARQRAATVLFSQHSVAALAALAVRCT